VIASRRIRVQRAGTSTHDAQGVPLAGTWTTLATVDGHLVERTVEDVATGSLLVVRTHRALLPVGTDVDTTCRLEAVDEPGVYYRVSSVSARRTPFGVHHLSVRCDRSDT